MMTQNEKKQSVFKRFIIYQKERFPVVQHGLLILVFTFSSVNYSLNARNATQIPSLDVWLVGAITVFLFFLLLRLFDEFKDAEEDAQFRPYRPVPRGLVLFKELKILIGISIGVILLSNAIFTPKLLPIVLLVLLYIGLMTKEFFVAKWLKKHPIWYMTSHMFVMPLFDLYSTGLDWVVQDVQASSKLLGFLIISYVNGMVIELGRKIRAKEQEEIGVETYSKIWGPKKAVIVWFLCISIVFVLSIVAMLSLNYSSIEVVLLLFMYLTTMVITIQFYSNPTAKRSKSIETMAGIWTLSMYLLLGGFSGIWRLIHLF